MVVKVRQETCSETMLQYSTWRRLKLYVIINKSCQFVLLCVLEMCSVISISYFHITYHLKAQWLETISIYLFQTLAGQALVQAQLISSSISWHLADFIKVEGHGSHSLPGQPGFIPMVIAKFQESEWILSRFLMPTHRTGLMLFPSCSISQNM